MVSQDMLPGLVGAGIGLVGGLVGTGYGVAGSRPGAERRFVLRMSAILWLAVLGMLAWLVWVPQTYTSLVWVPYGIGLPFVVRWGRRKQEELRTSR